MHRTNIANIFAFLFLFSFSVLILAVDKIGVFMPLKRTCAYLTIPVQGGIYSFTNGAKQEFLFLFQIQKIGRQYDDLKKDYARVLSQNLKLKAVQEENKILRAQFESQPETAAKLLPAKVVGLPKNLILDKGSSSGVAVGDIAVLENSFLGEVITVGSNYSNVRIPTDSASSITVYVDTPRGPKGLVKGSFDQGMILDKILPEEKLEVGQLVLTAGEEEAGNIPKGLILGKISKIKKDEAAVFQTAEIEPIWPYDQLATVFVSLEK